MNYLPNIIINNVPVFKSLTKIEFTIQNISVGQGSGKN